MVTSKSLVYLFLLWSILTSKNHFPEPWMSSKLSSDSLYLLSTLVIHPLVIRIIKFFEEKSCAECKHIFLCPPSHPAFGPQVLVGPSSPCQVLASIFVFPALKDCVKLSLASLYFFAFCVCISANPFSI